MKFLSSGAEGPKQQKPRKPLVSRQNCGKVCLRPCCRISGRCNLCMFVLLLNNTYVYILFWMLWRFTTLCWAFTATLFVAAILQQSYGYFKSHDSFQYRPAGSFSCLVPEVCLCCGWQGGGQIFTMFSWIKKREKRRRLPSTLFFLHLSMQVKYQFPKANTSPSLKSITWACLFYITNRAVFKRVIGCWNLITPPDDLGTCGEWGSNGS